VTVDERIEALTARHEALTARHEALTMSVEIMQAEGQKFRADLRRWAALGIKEGRSHRKRITELETNSADHRKRIAELETKSAEYQARTDQNLAEITDKLNGVIGYVDGKRNGGPKL
jgi:chromosome segregation ATPase